MRHDVGTKGVHVRRRVGSNGLVLTDFREFIFIKLRKVQGILALYIRSDASSGLIQACETDEVTLLDF